MNRVAEYMEQEQETEVVFLLVRQEAIQRISQNVKALKRERDHWRRGFFAGVVFGLIWMLIRLLGV